MPEDSCITSGYMWIILSLLAGLGDALRDAVSKRATTSVPRPLVTWAYSLCALPFFLPNLFINLPNSIPHSFWIFLLFASSCHVAGGLLLVKALQLSELSLCIPMVAFTPVFLLVIGPMLTGDMPSAQGVLGAVLVASGSYVLNLDKSRNGLLGPIKALFEEKGARIMLGLALLWSITGSVDRIAVQKFDISFWASAQLCTIAILLIPILVKHQAFSSPISKGSALSLLSLGVFNALSLGAYLLALQAAPVHYVICLKRSSILFSVLLGRIMFQERFLADRLPGAILMLAGVVTISLAS